MPSNGSFSNNKGLSVFKLRCPLGVFYKLTVTVSAFIVLLAASGGAVLGNVVRTTSWTGHLDLHWLRFLEISMVMTYFLYPLH
jgi:hypothetical protein